MCKCKCSHWRQRNFTTGGCNSVSYLEAPFIQHAKLTSTCSSLVACILSSLQVTLGQQHLLCHDRGGVPLSDPCRPPSSAAPPLSWRGRCWPCCCWQCCPSWCWCWTETHMRLHSLLPNKPPARHCSPSLQHPPPPPFSIVGPHRGWRENPVSVCLYVCCRWVEFVICVHQWGWGGAVTQRDVGVLQTHTHEL